MCCVQIRNFTFERKCFRQGVKLASDGKFASVYLHPITSRRPIEHLEISIAARIFDSAVIRYHSLSKQEEE